MNTTEKKLQLEWTIGLMRLSNFYCVQRMVIRKEKIMKRLANKSAEELKEIREQYIGKYIGDFNKPWNYKQELKQLDKLIAQKE